MTAVLLRSQALIFSLLSICNSIYDVETADSASLLMNDDAMNDEDANFEDRKSVV